MDSPPGVLFDFIFRLDGWFVQNPGIQPLDALIRDFPPDNSKQVADALFWASIAFISARLSITLTEYQPQEAGISVKKAVGIAAAGPSGPGAGASGPPFLTPPYTLSIISPVPSSNRQKATVSPTASLGWGTVTAIAPWLSPWAVSNNDTSGTPPINTKGRELQTITFETA